MVVESIARESAAAPCELHTRHVWTDSSCRRAGSL